MTSRMLNWQKAEENERKFEEFMDLLLSQQLLFPFYQPFELN